MLRTTLKAPAIDADPISGEEAGKWLAALALYGLLIFSMLAPLISTLQASGEGSVVRQLVYFVLLGIAILSSRGTSLLGLREIPKTFILLLAWSAASLLWALDPLTGSRRLLLTVLIVAVIFLLVGALRFQATTSIIRKTLVAILILNYLAVAIFPQWSIHQADAFDPSIVGAWHGIVEQKNYAGAVCAFTILAFLFDAANFRRIFRVAIILLATFYLLKTESKTSGIILCASIIFGGALHFYNAYYKNLLIIFILLAVAAASLVVAEYWDAILAPFQSEDALTGRVQIWPVLLAFANDHLILGAGYGSFWNISGSQPIDAYSDSWVTRMFSGHNGYLDLLVQLGVPGLTLAVFAAVIAPIGRLWGTASVRFKGRSFVGSIIFFCVCHNLTESSMFDRDAVVNVFLVLSIALLSSKTKPEIKLASH